MQPSEVYVVNEYRTHPSREISATHYEYVIYKRLHWAVQQVYVTRITLGWVIDRSFTHIARSVGNTFTFDVVQVTGSNLTWNVSFIETLARAYKHISLVPQEMKRSR